MKIVGNPSVNWSPLKRLAGEFHQDFGVLGINVETAAARHISTAGTTEWPFREGRPAENHHVAGAGLEFGLAVPVRRSFQLTHKAIDSNQNSESDIHCQQRHKH